MMRRRELRNFWNDSRICEVGPFRILEVWRSTHFANLQSGFDPGWRILGTGSYRIIGNELAANDSTFDPQAGGLTGSFGLGLEYLNLFLEYNAFVRFGSTPRTLTGTRAEYGRAILQPDLAATSLNTNLWFLPYTVQMNSNYRSNQQIDRELFTDFQFGLFVRGTLGMGNWRTATAGDPNVSPGVVATSVPLERSATTFGWDFGPAARLMNRNRLGVTMYGGFSVRNLVGDAGQTNERVTDDDFCVREFGAACGAGGSSRLLQDAIFGEGAADRPWWGGNVGLRASFADLTIDFQYMKLTDGANRRIVDGLTGGQLLTTIEFRGGVRLPSGGNDSPEFNEEPIAKLTVSGTLADGNEFSPTDTASQDAALFQGARLVFDASESESRHTITSYEWVIVGPEGNGVVDSDNEDETYSIDLEEPGAYSVAVVIVDAHGASDRQTWSGTVHRTLEESDVKFEHEDSESNPLEYADDTTPPQLQVQAETTVVTRVSLEGTTLTPASIEWRVQPPTDAPPTSCDAGAECRLDLSAPGEYRVSAEVTVNGHLGTVTRSFTIEVEPPEEDSADDQADGTAEDGTAEDGTAEDGTAEDGTAEDGTAEDGTAEDGTAEDGTAEDGTAEDGTAEDGTAEDGTAEDGTAEDGTAEDGTAEDGTAEDGTGTGGTGTGGGAADQRGAE
jgi:hypothetical protein